MMMIMMAKCLTVQRKGREQYEAHCAFDLFVATGGWRLGGVRCGGGGGRMARRCGSSAGRVQAGA
mgnify:CR=1 FL=1